MPTPLPTPVAAALGLVPTVLSGVRALPGKALQLPVFAISSALTTLATVRREYDELAERGELFIGRLRGDATDLAADIGARADQVEGRVAQFAGSASVGVSYEKVQDALQEASRQLGRAESPLHAVRDLVEEAAGVETAVSDAVRADVVPGGRHEKVGAPTIAEQDDHVPAAEQPKGAATPKAPVGEVARLDTAATPEVVQTVQQAVEQVAAPQILDHDDLPLPDYDHMTLGSLRGRMRSLSLEQLAQVRSYEKAHADRLPIVTMLDNRIARLATGPDAAPAGPVSVRRAPEQRDTAGPRAKRVPKSAAATRQATDGPMSPSISAGADQRSQG